MEFEFENAKVTVKISNTSNDIYSITDPYILYDILPDNVCCIYVIRDVRTGRGYVGSTKNLKNRLYNHFINTTTSFGFRFKKDFSIPSIFILETMDCELPKKQRIEREHHYCKLLDTYTPKGYNIKKNT